ncbi:MAG: CYTH domain-containing protein [Vulcanibacillus sp.]
MQDLKENDTEKEIEIEYKALLSEERFEELLSYFSKFTEAKAPYIQTNYYFDTKEHILIKQGITVRLRNTEDSWKLQIKIPKQTDGLFNKQEETGQVISKLLAGDFVNNGIDGYNQLLDSVTILKELDIERLSMIGVLQTLRYDFMFYTDTISLDKSTYLGITDYELEWETNNHKFVLYELNKLGLVPIKNIGKINRFLHRLLEK